MATLHRWERQGEKYVLALEPEVIAALGIATEVPIRLTREVDRVILEPVSEEIDAGEIAEALERLYPRYEQMLQNLAK